MDTVRVDRWLCAARLIKSRTLASRACQEGRIAVNGREVRASQLLRAGDELKARLRRRDFEVLVLGLAEKRQSPQQARELYEDRTPERPAPPPEVFARPRGAGRPTKADRRKLERARRFATE